MSGRSRRVTRRTGLLRRMGHVAFLAVALLVVGMISVPATSAATPSLKVRDTSVTETSSAGQVARIKVRLSGPATSTVKVRYRTVDGTATAPVDYRTRAGTLRFRPGQRTRTVSVPIVGDQTDEADETFGLRLAHPLGARIARRASVVTIVDDDGPGLVVDNPATVSEGGVSSFKVSLPAPSTLPVSVSYATANGSAVAAGDYVTRTGTLTFAPGETSKTVTVSTVNDTVDEVDEYFYVSLSSPVNAGIGDGTGGAFIDDDDGPAISVYADSARVLEGDTAVFTVWLSGPSVQPVSVRYQTSNGSAVAPGDYTPVSGTLTFAPGQYYRTVEVTTTDDAAVADDDEYFSLALSNPVDASIANASAVVRLNEAMPLGTVRGDDGGDVIEQTSSSTPAGDVDWYRFRLEESELGLTDDLSALVQLVVPEGGGDLDLYVYLADGTLVGNSVEGGTEDEAVPVARTDTAADDSIDVYVLVDQYDGPNGYTLRVSGNI